VSVLEKNLPDLYKLHSRSVTIRHISTFEDSQKTDNAKKQKVVLQFVTYYILLEFHDKY